MALREGSARGNEALVFWAGIPIGQSAYITELLIPMCHSSYNRLVVPQDERSAVLAHIRTRRLLVFADLHTHPGAAYLSEADRVRPFSNRPGFYAVVVPNFATGMPGSGWRAFEAVPGGWTEVMLDARIESVPV